MSSIPPRLYKYRTFDSNSLRALHEELVYYASPGSFNDPLDCRPIVAIDIGDSEVEELWSCLFTTLYGERRAAAQLMEMGTSFDADDNPIPDSVPFANVAKAMARGIDGLLARRLEPWGVLSLSSRWDSPLMWSHYADQHRGFCVEFDMATSYCPSVRAVTYSKTRSLKASDLYSWIVKGSESARESAFASYFFAKAPGWKYEKEWRVLRKEDGLGGAPFEISAVYFGVRCETSVMLSIGQLLRDRGIRFYGMKFSPTSFEMQRKRLAVSALHAEADRQRIGIQGFQDLVLLDSANA